MLLHLRLSRHCLAETMHLHGIMTDATERKVQCCVDLMHGAEHAQRSMNTPASEVIAISFASLQDLDESVLRGKASHPQRR